MKKNIISLSVMLGFALSAHADNERLVLTYNNGERVTIQTSYLKDITFSHEGNDKSTAYAFASMLANMNSGRISRIALEGLTGVDFLADFKNPLGITYYEVQRQHAPNAEVVMLNCINNNFGEGYAITDQRDTNWCGQRYGERGFFLIDTPLGFESTFTITGLDTGRRYNATWLLQNDTENPCGQSCWAFTMPKEPIRIVASAKEETIYENYDWLGTYSGFPMCPDPDSANEGNTVSSTVPTAMIDVKGNATYLFAASYPESLSAYGTYTYDENLHTIKYTPKPDDADLTAPTGQDEYAATMQLIASPFSSDNGQQSLGLVRVNNLTHDTPDNNRRYILYRGNGEGLTYFCAAKDHYGNRSTQYLVELTKDGESAWMHFTDYGAHFYPATLNFIEGTSIAGACTAIVSYDGEPQFKFVAGENGSDPQFLPLDEPEPTPGPGESADWTGPKTFYAKALGQLDGGAFSENADVTVLLDQNYNASANVGHAVLKANVGGKELIGSGGDYKYFPADHKVIIYHVLMGNDMGWQTDYYDLEINVADDLRSMTITGFDGYLYGSRSNTCIKVGDDCVLQAK